MKLPVLEPGECSGACCVGFIVHLEAETPQGVIDRLRSERADDGKSRFQDGDFIADMLLPYDGPAPPSRRPSEPNANPRLHRFACRHYQDKRCTRYEERPQMCRKFGVETVCTFAGCTFEPGPVWRQQVLDQWDRRHDPVVRKWIRAMVAWIRSMEGANDENASRTS